MYSVVLMMAVTAGGEAPDLGRRNGCCGGGCYGGRSACYGGCYGGGGCCGGYAVGYGGGCCGGYAVGYGGSLTWFGSSAGVAITKAFPQARDLGRYLKDGWAVALAYLAGFAVAVAALGWNPWEIPA